MRLYISHRASDLLHAPMYRLYRNKPDTAAYIIRECHVTEDIFKYQVVASVSTKALTIPEEREVLKQLKNNELSFIKESILFESLFNYINNRVKEIHMVTGIPYKTEYYWHPYVMVKDNYIHLQNEKRG